MPDLDLVALRNLVSGGDIAVLVAERAGPGEPFRAYSLDLGDDLSGDFRDRAIATLAGYENLVPVPFEENTQLGDHELGMADRDIVDIALLDLLERAARAQPETDHDARPERLRLYAVAATTRDHVGLLIRAQNPVRHLRPDHLTLRFLRGRLTRADPLFVYDATFDLLVHDDAVAIRSQSALEAVFIDPERREQDTATALVAVAGFIREIDHAALAEVAGRDSRYATKLRRMYRSAVFETVDMTAIVTTIAEFNLELRVIDGRISFPQRLAARWELLYALEDAYVFGRATGRPYLASAKRFWQRRSVDHVTLINGRVTEVDGPGDWSPLPAAGVIADLRARRRIEYIARLDDGPAPVEIRQFGDAQVLWVAGADDLTNRLLELSGDR
jgi:hypothetical protein